MSILHPLTHSQVVAETKALKKLFGDSLTHTAPGAGTHPPPLRYTLSASSTPEQHKRLTELRISGAIRLLSDTDALPDAPVRSFLVADHERLLHISSHTGKGKSLGR